MTLISLYLLPALVLQNLMIGEKKTEGNNKFVAFVASGGIHTEFIFPTSNSIFDWTQVIPVNLVTEKMLLPKFISIGWEVKISFST